ncbi:hypothetical protein [Streptomyces sp. NRRL B-24484]|uniref:hypothetical protein n=1 Tax=Streptomyces sp. NRRL B-24484 TaxID=1463833 RepID=UPI0005B997BA|nr:hypothetical protein [Streptomyces sp. NRRL B-24484]
MTRVGDGTPPPHLTPRWRDLPRLAVVSAHAYAPPRFPRGPIRGALAPVWLIHLGIQHAAGSVLAIGPSTLAVLQPRRLGLRIRGALVGMLGVLLLLPAVIVPTAVVAFALGNAIAGPTGAGAVAYTVLGAELAILVWQFAHLLTRVRHGVELRRELAILRRTGPWGEIGGLVGGRDGHATRHLVRQTLAWADEQGLGLAAVAANARLRRAYAIGGFHPARPGSPVLLRPPTLPAAARTELLTPGRPTS